MYTSIIPGTKGDNARVDTASHCGPFFFIQSGTSQNTIIMSRTIPGTYNTSATGEAVDIPQCTTNTTLMLQDGPKQMQIIAHCFPPYAGRTAYRYVLSVWM